jgi:hypothetical protein
MAKGSVSFSPDEIGDREDTAGPGPTGLGGAATGSPGCAGGGPDVSPPAGSNTNNQPRATTQSVGFPGASTNNQPRPEDFMD